MFNLQELQQALDGGEFFLEYLPTITLADGRCVGAETLIRWQRGDEVVYPLEFIPLAENTWLSGRITYWVVETVSHELRDWLLQREGLHISINVPPEIIGRGGLTYAARTSRLSEVLDKIMFEVTERGILDELGIAGLNLALRSGQQIALDDISVNDASLLVLSRVNASTVKRQDLCRRHAAARLGRQQDCRHCRAGAQRQPARHRRGRRMCAPGQDPDGRRRPDGARLLFRQADARKRVHGLF
jgi:EAL domain-containing protein (putative c-di-GMP-specific phosphodiesterase class I)